MEENSAYILDLKKYMIEKLRADIPGVQFNGDAEGDSNYILLNVSFPSFSNKDMMLFNLDIMGVAASSGSACSHLVLALDLMFLKRLIQIQKELQSDSLSLSITPKKKSTLF